jgi:hypothetical protein
MEKHPEQLRVIGFLIAIDYQIEEWLPGLTP